MNITELINDILQEWSYRTDGGYPLIGNPTHLSHLSDILSEMELDSIKYELIENIQKICEADEKKYSNPILNKKVTYVDAKGAKKTNLVGSLLRLSKDQPGRKAAEKMLPPDGSDERKQLDKELGSERDGKTNLQLKQTTSNKKKPASPKSGEEVQGAAMFKSDPTIQAQLSKEKAVQFKASKSGDFNPIKPKAVTKQLPKASSKAFSNKSDILKIPDVTKMEVSTKIDQLAKMAKDAKEKGEKAPNYNLCKVTIPGTNLYCDKNLGIPREDMPQFKGKPQEGTPAAAMDKDVSGEVDTEPMFRKMLAGRGVKVVDTEIPSDRLKATQSELVGAKVAGMEKALESDPTHSAITAPIYVSRDGYVVDGHHRWAAITSKAIRDGKPTMMKVHVIDMDAKDIIPMANEFAEKIGVAAKKADANAEGPKKKSETPKTKENPNLVSKVNRNLQVKVKKWTHEEKKFFKGKEYAKNSNTRRTIAETIKDKAAGIIKSMKHGLKHEVHTFKVAGSAAKDLFSGHKLDNAQKEALKQVGTKIATNALIGVATGGLGHGVSIFAEHLASEFIPHIISEIAVKGVTKAALFAGEEDDTADLNKFMEKVADAIENMNITAEQLESFIDDYNEKTEK